MPDDSEWSAKDRYEYVVAIIKATMTDHSSLVVASEQQVRLKAVSHGSLSVDEYERALRALEENREAVVGDAWLSYPADEQMLVEAIETVAEESENPGEFVASANAMKRDVFEN